MIKHVICDLDGVLYELTDEIVGHMVSAHHSAAAEIAGVNWDKERVRKFIFQSKDAYGDFFAKYLEEHLDSLKDIFRYYHDLLDVSLMPPEPGGREEMERLIQVGLQFSVLTHSDENMARRWIRYHAMEDLIKENRVFGLDNRQFINKQNGPLSMLITLDEMKADAGTAAFIEDSASNLEPAHKTGMYTIYVHRGKKLEPKPDFIDFQCATYAQALQHIGAINTCPYLTANGIKRYQKQEQAPPLPSFLDRKAA